MTAVDIHAFNLARVAEDEAIALGCTSRDWVAHDATVRGGPRVETAEPDPRMSFFAGKPFPATVGSMLPPGGPHAPDFWTMVNLHGTTGKFESETRNAAHIARHDPARALREVAAKRRILERHHPAAHPNYRFYDTDPIVYTCVGCGYDTNSCGEHEPRTEDINDCPELRDIAAIYADHEDYAPKWSATP